ncbi:hypothetical protein JCM3765_005909 [Sporobolomyces pararoseus]
MSHQVQSIDKSHSHSPNPPPLQTSTTSSQATTPQPYHFQQNPFVQAQLRAQRMNVNQMQPQFEEKNTNPTQSPSPLSTSTSSSHAHAQNPRQSLPISHGPPPPQMVYSPFPFPPSEHPLPPRNIKPNQSLPLPLPPQSQPQVQYFDQLQQFQTPLPPPQIVDYQSAIEYRFPPPNLMNQAQFLQQQPQQQQYSTSYQPHQASHLYPSQYIAQGGGVRGNRTGVVETLNENFSLPLSARPFQGPPPPPGFSLPLSQHHQQQMNQYQGEGVGEFTIHRPNPRYPSSSFVPPHTSSSIMLPPGLPLPASSSSSLESHHLQTGIGLPPPQRPHSTISTTPATITTQKLPPQSFSSSSTSFSKPIQQLPSPPASPRTNQQPLPLLKTRSRSFSSPSTRNISISKNSINLNQISPQSPSSPETTSKLPFKLPPLGGIVPSLPLEGGGEPTSPLDVDKVVGTDGEGGGGGVEERGYKNCQVQGCCFPSFCSLSPCGDEICRDHLGTVIRGVKLKPRALAREHSEGVKEGEEEEEEMIKVYRCVRCGRQSEMVGPTPNQLKEKEKFRRLSLVGKENNSSSGHHHHQQQQQQGIEGRVGGIEGGGVGGKEGQFSIHYFSSGPSGGGGNDHKRKDLSASQDMNKKKNDKNYLSESITSPSSSFDFSNQAFMNYNIGLIPKPPSPPFPLELYPLPDTLTSPITNIPEQGEGGGETTNLVQTYYQTPFGDGGGSTPPREGLIGADDSSTKIEQIPQSHATVLDVESQTIEPFLLSPPTPSSRSLPHPPPVVIRTPSPVRATSPSFPLPEIEPEEELIQHPTREDAVHLLEEDPSILSVSTTSPPSTPFQQPSNLSPLDSQSPSSPSSSSSFSFTLPSPHPTSDYFAKYSFSSTEYRGRGRGRSRGRGVYRGRGGRGRGGWDPKIHGPWLPFHERRSTIDRTISEEDELREGGGGEGDYKVSKEVSSSPPEEQLQVWKTKKVGPGLRGNHFVVKVSNVPFSVLYREIQNWLPLNVLPKFQDCPQPIHIILHRASGRTLPHCYIELKDQESALKVMQERDRTVLVTRTVRVRAERVGELMRDLFDQSKYFSRSNDPASNPALDPLPSFPEEGYKLPPQLLNENDLQALESWLSIVVSSFRSLWYDSNGRELTRSCDKPWSHFALKPVERAYTHLGSILSKFPFEARPDLWNANVRDHLFYLICRAISLARSTKGYLEHDFAPIAERLIELVSKCPGFTPEQRDHYSTFTLKDFPPLSSPSKPSSSNTVKRSLPSPSTRNDRPPASSNVPDSHEYESTVYGDDPSPESAPPDWLRGRRNSSFEPSNAPSPAQPTPSRRLGEPQVLYWAEELLPKAEWEREKAPPVSSVSGSHSTSVSIPPSSWFESTSSKSPVTPIDNSERRCPPSIPGDFTEYPLTPPESPEAMRPRFSKGGASGRGRGWKP